ncbi:substrate-binding periplasmic protein [Desulfovibrio ferrophilus]|uniref:ABC-type transporter, periplasmic subunit family 3 n=1 Tax=Desulfovibrio ferrophilus TaxID=241368 RepID=A0A2Z6AYR7_9BACT|nr:ABC transporter substrate-binding protein [Desulfovibrio ferrophilus]BBD08389.1 ABC-type transporter, periplasmic subunit family 3 [Desulfovibrio ferrophilus]
MFRSVAVALFILLTVGSCAQAETIRLATLEWPPYIGQELEQQGYVAEIIRTAFARSDIEVDLTFMPWKRTVEETRVGRFQGYVPEYFSQELRKDFVFSIPVPGGPLVLLARRGSGISYSTLKDLTPYRIGIVKGYVNTREFDAASYLNKQPFVDDLTNLRMLLRKRVDLVTMDLLVGLYLARKHLGGTRDIEALQPALEHKLLYLCFPKSRDDHLRLLVAFNSGITAMMADGTLAVIQDRHGFVQSEW